MKLIGADTTRHKDGSVYRTVTIGLESKDDIEKLDQKLSFLASDFQCDSMLEYFEALDNRAIQRNGRL